MKRTALFAADLFFLYGSLILMLLLRYPNEFGKQFALHVVPFSLIFILWIIVFFIHNLYDPPVLRNTMNFYVILFRSILIAAAISVVFFYLIPIFNITPRANLFLFTLLFSIFEVINRSFFNRVIERRFHKRTMIVGINPNALELAHFLKQHPQLGYEIRYMVDVSSERKEPVHSGGFPTIHGITNLDQIIRESKIATVIVSPEAYQAQEIIDVFYGSLGKVSFFNLASFYEKVTGKVPLGAINQIWFLENLNERGKKIYEAGKRLLDIIGVLVLGIPALLLSPIVILIIRWTSPGPVLYRQKRIGRGGRVITISKFRTMIADDPSGGAEGKTGPIWTTHNDPRITTIGRFLRKTRVDELPQLWNVLKGELSFVGPRTERPEFHETLKKQIPFYEERYLVKPGLTGLSQITYGYGASVSDAAEKLQYDLYYIKNRSLGLDTGILLKTINIILRAAGR